MQISKISLALCVMALGTTPVIRAADTPAQASARAAIASKLFEISAETPVTNKPAASAVKAQAIAPAAAPAAKTVVKTVAAPAVVPVVKPIEKPVAKPVVKATEPVMVPMDKKAKAKAEQAAADAKAAELKAQKEAAKIAAAQKEKDEAAAKAQAKVKAKADKLAAEAKAKADAEKAVADAKAKKLADKKAAEQKAAEVTAAKQQVKSNLNQPKVEPSKTSATVKTTDTPEQAKAREALARSLFQDAASAPTATATKPIAPKPAVKAEAKLSAPAIVSVAPPLPINSIQQHKLAELLVKYKADKVTPDEYQKLRAAILANP